MTSLAILLLLVGCTGTQEESIPIILVVGSVEAGGPQLQLFEDVRDPPPRDLVPVGTPIGLPAAPVSVDLVDRNGDRNELVVLDENGTIHYVDISDMPRSFAVTRSIDVAALIPTDPSGSSPCWNQVQVGGTSSDPGRYAALLEVCSDGLAEVYVVDLIDQEFLYALTQDPDATQLLPIGIHVDQGTDRLYFALANISDTAIAWVPLQGGEITPLGTTGIDPALAVDIAPLANGVGVLGDDGDLGVVPFEGDSPSPVDLDLSAATTLLPDPSSNVELLAAFSDTRGSIVDGLDDLEPESLFLQEPLIDATLEPVQRFAYLLEEGGIEILDLFPYADEPANRLLFFDLPGLDDPRVITWAFGTRITP